MNQVGTDYADLKQVEAYDERMGSFRDIEAENREMLAMLALAAVMHVKQEYSTFDWIMEGLITRAGLKIVAQQMPHPSFTIYHCRKPA